MLKPLEKVDEKLNKLTETDGWKFWQNWKYPILSGLLALGIFAYNGVAASANTTSSTWTSADFETWKASSAVFSYDPAAHPGDSDETKALLSALNGMTNAEIYNYFKSQLKSEGRIEYDHDSDGNPEVVFDAADFDTLLKMALTPYTPPTP